MLFVNNWDVIKKNIDLAVLIIVKWFAMLTQLGMSAWLTVNWLN